MKIFQRDNDDCLRACVATVLGVTYEQAPDLAHDPDWKSKLYDWSKINGWHMEFIYSFKDFSELKNKRLIGIGPSPRSTEHNYFTHAVIIDDNFNVVHDPSILPGDMKEIYAVITFRRTDV